MTLDPGTATRTRVVRQIAADPTSTALLLAGPTALELWPGLRRVAEVSGRVVVEADIADAARAASVRALPPQRTPTAYLTRFEWAGPGLPATTGELTLGYAPDIDGETATTAELVLTSSGFEGTLLDRGTLEQMARGFLDNLAHAAEVRNRAA
ncbi:MAG TPA: hypothetical protein VMZ11_02980 [Mycobacteriales bacterium]|nr:hypothetical protein [Mycobacteriales bacterium]